MRRILKSILWLCIMITACNPLTTRPQATITTRPMLTNTPSPSFTPALPTFTPTIKTTATSTITPSATATTIPSETPTPTELVSSLESLCQVGTAAPIGQIIGETKIQDEWFIFMVNSDGTGFQVLTEGEAPVWSPGGDKIVYRKDLNREAPSGMEEISLIVLDLDNSQSFDITQESGLSIGWNYAWSPNEEQIVFGGIRAGDDGTDLYLANADGSSWWKLLARGEEQQRPTWSADGSFILYSHSDYKLLIKYFYRINVNGSENQEIVLPELIQPYFLPDWSYNPIRNELLLVETDPPLPRWRFYIYSLVDEELEELITIDSDQDLFPYSWSQNGEIIAYTRDFPSEDRNLDQIYVLGTEDHANIFLHEGKDIYELALSSDGRYLAFVQRSNNQDEELLIIDICSQKRQTVLAKEDIAYISWRP